ncbi:homoserine dehydrogenase [Arthrobacter ginkgonis]|uniref:Homoserine dehydrogenase n=1 Tax=Arthrobacter ginkgonis TaxID=1630594 RepID=A0ABP7D378_9MICC
MTSALPSASPAVPLVLSGFGPVGQAFLEKIGAQQQRGIAVTVIRGQASETTLGPGSGVPDRASWHPLAQLEATLDRTGAGVLVQALPSSPEAHPRAVDEAITALRRGVHVVTATKSHLLTHWRDLEQAARTGGSRIRISGATGAALPTADLARLGVRGLDCHALRACPNGTSTFVLDRISDGGSLKEAVREARRCGIAEADTSADLSGSDAATKARLLAGLLWDWDVARIQIETEAIDEGTVELAAAAARSGRRLRAVASASLDRPMTVTVRLERVGPGDPFFHITGPEKAMTFHCPDAGDITVQGGRSSPTGAALAMVKDVLNLVEGNATGFH